MKKVLPFLVFIFAPHNAFALCVGLSLQGVPATATFQGATGEYSVYDPAEYMQAVNFQVRGGASLLSCSYFVTLSAGSSGNVNQRQMLRAAEMLNYNAYTSAAKANILKDTATGGASDVIAGSFPLALGLNQTNNHSLYWTITPSQVVPAGASRFQDSSLTLNLYSGILLGVNALVDSKTITFQSRAESSVDLSLVDTGTVFSIGDTAQTIDFGTLASGASLAYDTIIRSNDGYLVTLQSQNSGVLKHQAAPAVADTVPYGLAFGGSAVNLSSGAAVQAASSLGSATPVTGSRFATVVTVGALTGSETAGNYHDVITVTVSAH